MSERKPLLSDDEVRKLVDRWIATSVQSENETRMVRVAVCDPPYPASLVRDFYENLITTGKLRVVGEVELVWRVDKRGIGCHYCPKCERPHPAQLGGLPAYFCPGCGNPIKR